MKRLINVSMILVLLLGFLPQATANAEAPLLWEQLPIEVNDATSSMDSQLIADDFVLTEASSINQIEIWNRMEAPVETYYYIHANAVVNGVNVPGETLATGMLTPSVTAEDATICNFYACAYRHTLNLASPIELEPGHYWLSVFGWYGSGFSWSYAYAPADLPTFAWEYIAGPWTGTFEGGLAFRLLGPQVCSASIEVQNSNDAGTGSLRQAIIDVCPGGTITFNSTRSGQTIELSSQLTLDKDLTIDGSALTNKVTIDVNGLDRVLFINPAKTVSLDSLIITGGFKTGIFNDNGGGINNQGVLTLSNSSVVANTAGIGSGIYNAGTLSITNSSLTQNNASNGGAINNSGGSATLTDCTISDNAASAGAGIDLSAGTLTVRDSTFSGNIASTQGGGIYVAPGLAATIFGSTFVNNTAGELGGGGIVNFGTTSVVNSTFTGNVLTDAWARGSAINNHFGTLTLYNSTLSGNTGFVTLNNETGSMSLANTIIANTTSGWDCSTAYGTLTDSINNWVSDGGNPSAEKCGATNFGDPMLGALAENGGPTLTMALLETSLAIDAGDDAICSGGLVGGVDQRGVGRPQGIACDIGAYELEQTTATGSLKISKVFDPLTSGFTGTFTIFYDCGGEYHAYISLGAGGSQTFSDIPVGSQCSISESTLPTPPAGWSFGTPSISPSGIVTISETLAEVVVTNTIIQDVPQTGELMITKVFDPLTSGFTDTFAIAYDCDDGTDHDGSVNLLAAGSETISGIPLGTTCTITEDTLPTPPTGWSFGLPTFAPETGAVTITEASPAYVEVLVTNTISRDLGDLTINKSFESLTSDFAGTFAINYDCNDGTLHDGTVNLAAGGTHTISGIPTGTQCTVTEPNLPTAPDGWSFGTPTFNPESGIVTIPETSITNIGISFVPIGATVTVTNTISRDTGDLKISKVFVPGDSGFTGTFAIEYDCDGTEYDGRVYLAAGISETIYGIPTGTTCNISEPTLPVCPTGWTFGTPTYNPADGIVTISETLAEVTVTNTISRDLGELKITKVFNSLDSGFTGTFAINYDCDDGTLHDGTVNLAAGGTQTISGIPTGTQCTVTEPTVPTAPEGWSFGTPTFNPSDGIVTIGATPIEVTVTNIISQDVVEVLSQLTTAKATCIQFSSGTATDVDRLLYTSTYNKKIHSSVIKSVTPSTFLYYVKANLPAEASSLVIAQVNDLNFPAMLPSVTLYDASCVRLSPTLGTAVIANGNVTVSFTSGAAERVVYVGVKYSARPLIGQAVTGITDIGYSFSAALGGAAAFTSDDLAVMYIQ